MAIKNEGKTIEPTNSDTETVIPENASNDNILPDGVVFMDKGKDITTTREEIDAYNIISSIVRKQISTDLIVYKDFKSYFAIGIGNASYWWGCRLAFGSRKKNLYLPTKGYKSQERIELKTLDDIFKYTDQLEQAFEMSQNSYENYKSKQ